LEFLLCTLTPEVQCRLVHRNHMIWLTEIKKNWRNENDLKQPYWKTVETEAESIPLACIYMIVHSYGMVKSERVKPFYGPKLHFLVKWCDNAHVFHKWVKCRPSNITGWAALLSRTILMNYTKKCIWKVLFIYDINKTKIKQTKTKHMRWANN
jgi:hypothetical protein